MNQRGSTTAEYVGIVIVIVLVFIGLVAVRSATLGDRAPVRPLPAILRLVQAPLAPIAAPRPVRPPRPPVPRPPRRPRAADAAPPTVLLPPWASGR